VFGIVCQFDTPYFYLFPFVGIVPFWLDFTALFCETVLAKHLSTIKQGETMPNGKFKKLRQETKPNNNNEVFTHECLTCYHKTGWDNGEYLECSNCCADNEKNSIDW